MDFKRGLIHKGIKYILAQENNCIVENHCIAKTKQLQCPIFSLNLPFTANYFDRLSAAEKVLRAKKGILCIKKRGHL